MQPACKSRLCQPAFALTLVLVLALRASAGLVAPQSIPELSRKADLIVVGSAAGGPIVGTVGRFTVQVVRVIKGSDLLAGATINVECCRDGPQSLLAPAGGRTWPAGKGIWFLRQSGLDWSLLPITEGGPSFDLTFFSAPVSAINPAYAYKADAPLSDKLASEIASAFEAVTPQPIQLEMGLESVDHLSSSVAQVLYQRLADDATAPHQLLGLSGLIRRGSMSALTQAVSSAPQWAALLREPSVEYGMLLSSIREYFRSNDPAAIEILGKAATDVNDPNTGFRAVTAHALASIHTAQTLPYLAALLEGSHAELRAEGIGGLGSYALGLPVQTSAGVPSLSHLQINSGSPYYSQDTVAHFAMGVSTISGNEAGYLTFWKSWWEQNRAGLGF